jgi:PAS domain-containing protein
MNEEQLLEFLYLAPIALIQFDEDGNVKMANPRIAQLFNRYAPGGYFANFFDFLEDVLPELREKIKAYDSPSGQLMENSRFCINAPTESGPSADSEELWLDVTITRPEQSTFIASLNNVTNQVRAEAERYVAEQKMTQVLESVSKNIIFTMSKDGVIDSWNKTGDTYLMDSHAAVGKLLSQVLDISVPKNAELLKTAKAQGAIKEQIMLSAKNGQKYHSNIYISSIHDQRERHCGYSVVITLTDTSHQL